MPPIQVDNIMFDLMIDIEAFSGNHNNSVIVSIGAVAFDPGKIETVEGLLNRGFYCNVNGSTCEKLGMSVSSKTIYWWLQQDKEAQLALLENRIPIGDALNELSNYYRKMQCDNVWANPSMYDLAIIVEAYRLTNKTLPWKMNSMIDCRTIWKLYNRKPINFEGLVKHNALHDAVRQAINLQTALSKIYVDLE